MAKRHRTSKHTRSSHSDHSFSSSSDDSSDYEKIPEDSSSSEHDYETIPEKIETKITTLKREKKELKQKLEETENKHMDFEAAFQTEFDLRAELEEKHDNLQEKYEVSLSHNYHVKFMSVSKESMLNFLHTVLSQNLRPKEEHSQWVIRHAFLFMIKAELLGCSAFRT